MEHGSAHSSRPLWMALLTILAQERWLDIGTFARLRATRAVFAERDWSCNTRFLLCRQIWVADGRSLREWLTVVSTHIERDDCTVVRGQIDDERRGDVAEGQGR